MDLQELLALVSETFPFAKGKIEGKHGETSLFYFIGDYFASALMSDDVSAGNASGSVIFHAGNWAHFYRKQEKPPDFSRSWTVIRGSASSWDQVLNSPVLHSSSSS